MYLERTTAPAATPVTLAEAKAHVRYAASDSDDLITALIQAATTHLEGRNGILGRALITQTWEWRVDYFPACLEVPLPPLQSVTSVKYLDDNGVEQTLDPSAYVVEAHHRNGRIRPVYNTIWPTTRPESGAVRIVFVAGYGDAAAVPQPIKHAILLLVGHWWFNREAVGDPMTPVPLAVEALTNPFRILEF